ncbi:hypothetical protein C3L23_00925 [Nautilia sp. PV-1]|uniref:hypothetical protein n=1 Tax=Nautilia sp. PV-1 TaxID=2579250 RepID=UPI000FDB74D2|nr:hypothetical protein [Nautilia sp. PV-1]AZV45878.1 hypothetical protein C3L23_00925 [Nautilia sp. PV-1]
MKKIILPLIASLSFALSPHILPDSFAQCLSINYYTPQNAPIALNDFFKIIKKYECSNNIVYIGIENRIPGILKLNVNNDTKNFLLKHLTINGFKSAVYIDKKLQKGVIAVQLNDKYTLKLLFYGNDYNKYVNILKQLDLKKIKSFL